MKLDNTRSVPLFRAVVAAWAAVLVLIIGGAAGCGRKAKPEPLRGIADAPADPGIPTR